MDRGEMSYHSLIDHSKLISVQIELTACNILYIDSIL
jgi:hypothetical protein